MPVLSDPEQLLRLTEARYADGAGALVDGASPVDVARIVFDQSGDMPNGDKLSTLFVTWGQFLDHDMSLTPATSGEFVSAPGLVRPIERSDFDPATGLGPGDPRMPVNVVTPEIDGSMVYGSTADREDALRAFEGGRLATSAGDLMPVARPGQDMEGNDGEGDPMFLAGDIRANENTGLLTLHTLFVREHNHWADRLAEDNPGWSDDRLFEAARSITETVIQTITYDAWLPHLLSETMGVEPVDDLLSGDWRYEPGTDGQISVEFSTAAFRMGHTMVSSAIELFREGGGDAMGRPLQVMETFFETDVLFDGYFDAILRGQAGAMAQVNDAKMIDDLNFFLEMPDGLSGFSLAAINILRGRDHGLESYLDVREQLIGDIDAGRIADDAWHVVSSDPAVQAALARVYDSVHDVELWVGGLAEDRPDGAQIGPVFGWIVADQFLRSRAADPTFGQLAPGIGADIRAELEDVTLSEVILRNSDIARLQPDVFVSMERQGAGTGDGTAMGGAGHDLLMGFAGSDRMVAMKGDDMLYGDRGRDTMFAGQGADMVEGGDANDRIFGQGGADSLMGQTGDDLLRGGAGADSLMGGDGGDTVVGQRGGDLAMGGGGFDMLRGGGGADSLYAGDGQDSLRGGGGADMMVGGDGGDRMAGHGGADRIFGGGQDDRAVGHAGDDTIAGGAGGDTLIGAAGADSLLGGQGGDSLFGNRGADVMHGEGGADLLRGHGGADRMHGHSGADILRGGGAADSLFGGSGADRLIGQNGADLLRGGAGADVLHGVDGADRL